MRPRYTNQPSCEKSLWEEWRKNRTLAQTAHTHTHEYTLILTHHPPCRYVPRKCSATNRIIKAKDHGSVQISIAKVDENGRYTGENQVYALCGFVRAMGESDDCMNRLTQRDGFLKNVWNASGN